MHIPTSFLTGWPGSREITPRNDHDVLLEAWFAEYQTSEGSSDVRARAKKLGQRDGADMCLGFICHIDDLGPRSLVIYSFISSVEARLASLVSEPALQRDLLISFQLEGNELRPP